MSTILKLVQGSSEWHAHRAKSRNASETPVVLGVSPWQTPYQLWLIRTGRAQEQVTPAMHRGKEFEPAARAAYELQTGQIMEALVLADGEYSASLDGITLAGDLVLEIKVPFKGRDSEFWKAVELGQVPEYYGWQIEHQLMVAGAKLCHLWVFDGTKGLLLEVVGQPKRWPEIHAAWDKFMECLRTDTPPPLNDSDIRTREDPEWEAAAKAYIAAKQQADVCTAVMEEAKAALLALTSTRCECGAGVSVTQFWKRGVVDYKRVPVLQGADLEVYRGPSRPETRIVVDK